MPHDTARDAELELQLVMTCPLLVDGLPVATACFLVISTILVARFSRRTSSTRFRRFISQTCSTDRAVSVMMLVL